MKLDRNFYVRDGLTVARELIGKKLIHRSADGVTGGLIVEAEAYMGAVDAAAHSFKGRTKRTEIQYAAGGRAYIYLIYGMHICFNVTANAVDVPEAVLIRALEPSDGIDLMMRRRNKKSLEELCNGPGKLTQAMGITMAHYGVDLCGDEIFIETTDRPVEIDSARRINVDYAGAAANFPWRFLMRGNKFISAPLS